jgi:uncharacterized glyoxalase superfamily protein PhnB
MQPTLTGIDLVTADVLALAGFYADLLDAEVQGDASFATVKVAGAGLAFFSIDGMEQMSPGSMTGAGNGRFTIEINVDDVEARYERLLAAGITIAKPLTTQPWGRRSVWVRDPDGNIVNFYQNVPAGA